MSGKQMYLLLDSWNKPLAKGVLLSPVGAELMQVQVLDDEIDTVTCHEVLQMIGIDQDERALKCRLVRSRNDFIVLEPLEVMDPKLRQNLRIPVCFDSFLYQTGTASGRRSDIRSVDLSCGGIAFYGKQGLEVDELVEIVLPITEQPLIVRSKILRVTGLNNERTLYAAKFVDICHDEEKMIRRAVFGIQIKNDRG